ncbi:MAG: metal-dependent hydrolase [Selenomonadaceae bacterium]|nr:metal-dependent hydrolase [Selenomonadaceae bacterium]
MKWINHQIVTGFIVCAATDDALFTASGIIGAVIPDRVEGSPPKDSSSYWKWRKSHRTWSHYPPIYLALIAAAQFAKNYYPNPTFALSMNLLSYILVGALLHIAEDSICGKVPVFTPRGKHGIKLFKVGSWLEYFFVVLIILICLFVMFGSIDSLIDFAKNYLPV